MKLKRIGTDKEDQGNDFIEEEFDFCEECRALGDDYIVDENGDLVDWCDYCSVKAGEQDAPDD